MLPVRVALLHYPQYVEKYSWLVRSLLSAQDLAFVYREDGPCTGHRYVIEERLRQACDFGDTDWLLTVGGTWPTLGPSPAEIMPLATASVLERPLPGVLETLRAQAVQLQPRAMLDCGVAGVRGATFLLNLPSDADLISIYLQTLGPVATELLQLLRREGTGDDDGSGQMAQEPERRPAALRARDFAAFLDRRRPAKLGQKDRGQSRDP